MASEVLDHLQKEEAADGFVCGCYEAYEDFNKENSD